MHASILILDEALEDAQTVRDAVLGFDYPTPPAPSNFPGRNSRERVEIAGLDDAVSRIVGERLEPAPRTAHGHARLALASDEGRARCRVHVDPQGVWSGILYLTPDVHGRGGTEFFRHRRTGTDRCPTSAAELPRWGLASFEDVDRRILEPEGTDPDAWESIMTVPMRWNRLLLLRPWLWHTAGPSFGATPEEGRLVLLFFWRRAG